MNKQIQALVDKEMSRREFVATIGFATATLMGFGSIMRFIKGEQFVGNKTTARPNGYGSRSYGS